MSIISAVKSVDYVKYMAKGIGAFSLYLVGRDAHCWGAIQSDKNVKNRNAQAAHYYMNNIMTLDKPSRTKDNLQKAVFKYELDNNLRGFINSITGYIKGFGSSLVSDVVPLGLGALALFSRIKPLAKLSAIGLCAMGVYSFFKDGLGIGKNFKEPLQ